MNQAVVFPTMMAPIQVVIPCHIQMIEEVILKHPHRSLGLLLTREGDAAETTRAADLHSTGVMVKVLKRLKLPDGSIHLLVHSARRFRVRQVLADDPFILVEPEYLEDQVEKSDEMDALSRTTVALVKQLSEINPFFTDEMRVALINAPSPGVVTDIVAFALALPKRAAQEFLETLSVRERFQSFSCISGRKRTSPSSKKRSPMM